MKRPNTTFAGQKVSIDNRYLELFRQEHNAKADGVLFRTLRPGLDAIMPVEYHGCGLIWLSLNWKKVLNGQRNPDYPLKSDIEYLMPPVPIDKREEATNRKDEAIVILKRFKQYQRDEYGVTIRRLFKERHIARMLCRADGRWNPSVNDFTRENGRLRMDVPSQNPHNEASNVAFAEMFFERNHNADEEHRKAAFEAIAEAKVMAYNSTFWDDRLDLEDVRLKANMSEPPDPFEYFPAFTKVDPANDLSHPSDYRLNFNTYQRQTIAYEYFDKGVDHFTDLSHDFTVNVGQPWWYPFDAWAVANDLGAERVLAAAGKTLRSIELSTNETNNFFNIIERDAGTFYTDGYIAGSGAITHYPTVDISGSAYTCSIYPDVDRTFSIDDLALTLQNQVAMRYIYNFMGIGSSSADPVSGYIENLDLKEVAEINSFKHLGRGLNRGLVRGL